MGLKQQSSDRIGKRPREEGSNSKEDGVDGGTHRTCLAWGKGKGSLHRVYRDCHGSLPVTAEWDTKRWAIRKDGMVVL